MIKEFLTLSAVISSCSKCTRTHFKYLLKHQLELFSAENNNEDVLKDICVFAIYADSKSQTQKFQTFEIPTQSIPLIHFYHTISNAFSKLIRNAEVLYTENDCLKHVILKKII